MIREIERVYVCVRVCVVVVVATNRSFHQTVHARSPCVCVCVDGVCLSYNVSVCSCVKKLEIKKRERSFFESRRSTFE